MTPLLLALTLLSSAGISGTRRMVLRHHLKRMEPHAGSHGAPLARLPHGKGEIAIDCQSKK